MWFLREITQINSAAHARVTEHSANHVSIKQRNCTYAQYKWMSMYNVVMSRKTVSRITRHKSLSPDHQLCRLRRDFNACFCCQFKTENNLSFLFNISRLGHAVADPEGTGVTAPWHADFFISYIYKYINFISPQLVEGRNLAKSKKNAQNNVNNARTVAHRRKNEL